MIVIMSKVRFEVVPDWPALDRQLPIRIEGRGQSLNDGEIVPARQTDPFSTRTKSLELRIGSKGHPLNGNVAFCFIDGLYLIRLGAVERAGVAQHQLDVVDRRCGHLAEKKSTTPSSISPEGPSFWNFAVHRVTWRTPVSPAAWKRRAVRASMADRRIRSTRSAWTPNSKRDCTCCSSTCIAFQPSRWNDIN